MVTRNIIKHFLLVLFLSIQHGLVAQSNLSLCYKMDFLPEIEGYYQSLDSIASTHLGDDYLIRFAAITSFKPEYAMQMELVERKYFIKVISFDRNLWYAKDIDSIKINESQIEVETEAAEQLLYIGKYFIENRIDSVCSPNSMDGDKYQFEVKEDEIITCGQIHNPIPNSPIEKLCRLCNSFKDVYLNINESDIIVNDEFIKFLMEITADIRNP